MKITKLYTFITLQQLMVATATYLMAELANEATHAQTLSNPQLNTLIFVKVTALAVCLLFSGSFVHLKITKLSSTRFFNRLNNWVYQYTKVNKNSPRTWRDLNSQNMRRIPVTKSLWETLNEQTHFETDAYATLLNVALTTLAVGLATGWILGGSLIATLIIGIYFVHRIENRIEKVTECELTHHTLLQETLNKSWDSIVLGNQPHLEKWLRQFENRSHLAQKHSEYSIEVKQGTLAWLSFFTNVAVVVAAGLQWAYSSNGVAVIVLLPRAFQIAFHSQILQSYWVQLKSLNAKKYILDQATKPFDLKFFPDPIKFSKLSQIQNAQTLLETIDQCLDQKIPLPKGRFQIKGQNGSGKSSLLIKLKELLSEQALYLPANHQFICDSETPSLSSGERDQLFLSECLSLSPKVLLLDEWDAHLSEQTRNHWNEKLNIFSEHSLLIEIVHRS